MLLTLRTTHTPASDLGYLLHKNPERVQAFEQSFGRAHVFYPELSERGCTAALLLDIDPIKLVRGRPGSSGAGSVLDQYVNDRPYAASSFLSVALANVFRSAMTGQSKERPELAATPIPLTARIAVVPCQGGNAMLRRLFEPLGYTVGVTPHKLDEHNDAWGDSHYWTLELSATKRVSELLTHLYVLIPVLDDEKHYWVGPDEVEKLLRHGEGWLASHPEREMITERYLKHRHSLVDDAITRLVPEEQTKNEMVETLDEPSDTHTTPSISLHVQRYAAVFDAIKMSGATRVLDLGCGEGRLLALLLQDRQFTDIVGMDVSYRVLEIAHERLHVAQMPAKERERIRLLHGSLMYRDSRLAGFDAAAVVEVIEHLDLPRLTAFERTMFEFAKPGTVVVTTPNAEYNVQWASLPAGEFRHDDHRFEWSRAQFQQWATRVAERYGYTVRFAPIGPDAPTVGSPTQMAIFTKNTPENGGNG